MPAPDDRSRLERVARLGAEAIEREVRPTLKPKDVGKFVAIDVDTGGFEIDEDDYSAVMRLRARLPSAEIWLARAGFPAAYQIRIARCSVAS